MPSSNKTSHLQLNKWLGADKPKKDDFNNDNQKIDEACRLLEQSVALLESAMKSADKTNEQAIGTLSATVTSHASTISSHAATIASHTSSISSHASSISSTSSTLSSHTANSVMHVTQAEKNAWSSNSGAVIGTYQGNGNATQKITLGYKPVFVLIFPVDDGLARVNWTSQMFMMNGGCITNSGSTSGMTLNSDGFTVEYRTGGIDGYQVKHNASGVKYVYLAFKQ